MWDHSVELRKETELATIFVSFVVRDNNSKDYVESVEKVLEELKSVTIDDLALITTRPSYKG